MSKESVRIFAFEDDFFHQENLKLSLDELGYQLVGLEDKAESALPKVQSANPDVVLLDIHLAGKKSGIDLGHQINRQLPTPIIYITSFADSTTFQKASYTHPYAYLTKPVETFALQSSIELALQHVIQQEEPSTEWESDIFFRNCFFVKIGQKLVKIHPEEVLYIEVSGNRYCQVVTQSRKAHIRSTLGEIQEKLAPSPFLRVHRSYLINPIHLEAIHEGNQSLMIGEYEIPLGKTYRDVFYERLRKL
ncbi:MAG: LytTR family transcriptional regulator DNA-binding domain-containing protein [Bacteroidia bacterium]|nr:LytTR family transcriptional regulator DNA-binding domain-containing protein [Bacteroidia bacterium]